MVLVSLPLSLDVSVSFFEEGGTALSEITGQLVGTGFGYRSFKSYTLLGILEFFRNLNCVCPCL